MRLKIDKISLQSRWVLLIVILGMFITSFALPLPGGINIRFYLIGLPLLFFFSFSSRNIENYGIVIRFFIPLLLFWIFQSALILFQKDTFLIKEHFLTIFIILIFSIYNFLFFSNFQLLQKNRNIILGVLLFVFLANLFLYFFLIFKLSIPELWKMYLSGFYDSAPLNRIENVIKVDKGIIPRNCGFHISPNFWAGFCLYAIFLVIMMEKITKKKDYLSLIVNVTIVICLFLTFSRGSILALLIGFFYYKLPSFIRRINRIKPLRFIVGVGIIGFTTFLIADIDFSKVYGVIEAKLSLEYLLKDARFRIWSVHLDSFMGHPFFGEGLQRSKEVFVSTIFPSRMSGAHNVFINLLNYMGVFGFSLFFILIAYLFRLSSFRNKVFVENFGLYRLIKSFLIILLVYSFFEHVFTTFFFWGIIVISCIILDFDFSSKVKKFQA